MTQKIHLNNANGQYVLVDDEDYPRLVTHNWCLDNTGYVVGKSLGRKVLIHRAIMQPLPGLQVDHVDGDKLDNRRANLRVCTHQQNSTNQGKRRMDTSSKYKGVSREGSRWRAQIRFNDKRYHLGCYETEIAAAREYDKAAIKLFGPFARLNFE